MEQMEALHVLLVRQHLPPKPPTDDSNSPSAAAADANSDEAEERAALKAEMEHVFTEAQQQLRYNLEDSPLYNASHELLMVTRRVFGCSIASQSVAN